MNGPKSNNKDFSLFLELLENLYNTSKKQLKFNEDVKVNFVKNDQNSLNALGKTASYNPETREVNLYFVGRHPKDLMRSFSHELVHHAQNCRGEFNNVSNTNEGYAQADAHLREMEREAYECGNMIFRDWEDEMKSKGVVPLFSGAPFATIQMGYNENLGDKKMSKKLNESQLRDIIRGVIQEMFDEDINEETTMDKMMDDNAAESVGAEIEAAGEEVAVSLEEEVVEENIEENIEEQKVEELEESEEIQEEVSEGNLNESFLPKGRSIRENARQQTYAKLVEKWCK
jgi:hypothetical protein